MRHLLVLYALFGLTVGCRGVLGIEEPPPAQGILGVEAAGKGGGLNSAGHTGDDEGDETAGQGGEAGPNAGRSGSSGSTSGEGGASPAVTGQGGTSRISAGQGGMNTPMSGGGAVATSGQGGTQPPDAGQGGGGAGASPMMTGGAGATGQTMHMGGSTAQPPDPCAMNKCTPQPPTCKDNTYVTFEAKDSCPDGCAYDMRSMSCPFGCTSEGCKSAPPDPCMMKTCMPKPPTCTDNTYVTFKPKDSCPGGCAYDMQSMSCPFGCTNEGCKTDPCAGVVCAPRKADCANPTTVRRYTPMCQSGICEYSSANSACPSQTPKCDQGECVACMDDADCSMNFQCAPSKTCIRAVVTVLDEVYTSNTMNFNASEVAVEIKPRDTYPADWTKPLGFRDGMAYVDLEVIEKPSTALNLYNICVANSTGYACIDVTVQGGS